MALPIQTAAAGLNKQNNKQKQAYKKADLIVYGLYHLIKCSEHKSVFFNMELIISLSQFRLQRPLC